MNLRCLITSEGSFLKKPTLNKPFFVLKTDLLNNVLWKPVNKGSELYQIKKLEIFKSRFLKNQK